MLVVLFNNKKYTLNKSISIEDFLIKNLNKYIDKKNIKCFLIKEKHKNYYQLVSKDFVLNKNFSLEIIQENNVEIKTEILNSKCSIILGFALQKYFKNNINSLVCFGKKDKFYCDFKISGSLSSNALKKITILMKKALKTITSYDEYFSIIDDKNLNDEYLKYIFNNNNKYLECIVKDKVKYYVNSPILNDFSCVKYFKLLSVSGININELNDYELIRIYGIVNLNEVNLNKHIELLENQKINDHRSINKDLKLFLFDKRIGAGLPILLEKGVVIKNIISNYLYELEKKDNYINVDTPVLGSLSLYETSGHINNYKDSMFPVIKLPHENLILRPMTCPHHCIVFKNQIVSYRDLPIRIAENSKLFRYETSGSLKGLERIRLMTLADSHIFLTENHIEFEIEKIIKYLQKIMHDFKIKISYFRLSMIDVKKDKFEGDISIWNNAEKHLINVLKKIKINYVIAYGEAAFYGPKIDVQIESILGNEITIATIQIDYLLGSKFNLSYINKNNEKQTPVIIHHGLIGTYERFLSILMEQYNGCFPLWLAPIQIALIPVFSEDVAQYNFCLELKEIFEINNLRVKIFSSNERLNRRILLSKKEKINYILVIGKNEIETKKLSINEFKTNKFKKQSIEEFLKSLQNQCETKD